MCAQAAYRPLRDSCETKIKASAIKSRWISYAPDINFWIRLPSKENKITWKP